MSNIHSNGVDASPVDSERTNLEIEKLRLEVHKLRHPLISSIKEFGWKDLTAVIVAIFVIMLAWMTGIFNVRQERLSLATDKLQIEKSRLEEGNAELEKAKSNLITERKDLERQLQPIRDELNTFKKESISLQKVRFAGFPDFVCFVRFHGLDPTHYEVEMIGCSPFSYTPDQIKHLDELFELMAEIPRLSSLKIRTVQLTKEQMRKIGQFKQLTSLVLISDDLTDDLLEPLSNLKNITVLGLAHNNIQHPTIITLMPDLDRVSFGHTDFDDKGLMMLTQSAHHIRELWLRNTKISDDGIK